MITEHSIQTIEPDVSVVTISGRLSLGNALISVESAVKRVIAGGGRKVLIDLSGLNFIDSAGIGMLIACNGEAELKGGKFRLVGTHGVVAQAFEVVHMSRIIPLDPDTETALKNFA